VIQLYDTTLRDGTQMEGISLSVDDKLKIARRLDELGVAFIEGGWPGSNPKDAEFFARARELEWRTARIAAFGSTCRVGGTPEGDANIKALLDSGAPVCTVVGKTWSLHVSEVLRTTPEENLRIIEQSLAHLARAGRRVIYDAEHFFDGWRADRAYALETLRAAVRGGAETLVLCDTNGGSMPWQIAEAVREVKAALGHPLGVHCHNDSETAVANSLAALAEGAVQVQGTINGYGERCGNANLVSVIPALELKLGLRCLPEGRLKTIGEVSRFVAEVANLAQDTHQPYVGKSAFAHKGGIHVAAMRRTAASYQHVDPDLVGNEMRVVVSELSGRGLFAEAMVKVKVDGALHHTAAEGDGPVDALDHALRKALAARYPEIADIHLTDYKVRILDPSTGTGAVTRVLLDSRRGARRWTTVGASTNIIEASWRALADAIEYGLTLAREA